MISPNLRIAFRFLTAKKRAMVMSLACTILGVGLFIVTQATTSGFERFFTKTILGINGAIRIEDKIQDTMRSMSAPGGGDSHFARRDGVKYIEGIEEPQALIEASTLSSRAVGRSTAMPRVCTAAMVSTVMVIAAPAMLMVAPSGMDTE